MIPWRPLSAIRQATRKVRESAVCYLHGGSKASEFLDLLIVLMCNPPQLERWNSPCPAALIGTK